MADLRIYKGLKADLPSTIQEGAIYVTTDKPGMYVDVTADKRIHISDLVTVANQTALNAITDPDPDVLYYVTEGNILAKHNGTQFVQINSLKDVKDSIGDLTTLNTTNKNTIVAAINEVNTDAVKTITTTDNSLEATKTNNTVDVKAKLDATEGNVLKLEAGKGLRVDKAEVAQIAKDAVTLTDYTVSVESPETTEVAKRYVFKQLGTTIGTIDIPKDMVVKSGTVQVNPDADHTGTFLVLTLANATEDKVYIDVTTLIDRVESGSQESDPVKITVTDGKTITAAIQEGSITESMLDDAFLAEKFIGTISGGVANNTPGQLSIQAKSLAGTADTSVALKLFEDTSAAYSAATDFDAAGAAATAKSEVIGTDANTASDLTLKGLKKYVDQEVSANKGVQSVTEGTTNGTINVDGTAVKVHGLGSAAYAETSAFDASGAAATAKSEVIGTADDTSSTLTLNGLKKAIQESTIQWGSF